MYKDYFFKYGIHVITLLVASLLASVVMVLASIKTAKVDTNTARNFENMAAGVRRDVVGA